MGTWVVNGTDVGRDVTDGQRGPLTDYAVHPHRTRVALGLQQERKEREETTAAERMDRICAANAELVPCGELPCPCC